MKKGNRSLSSWLSELSEKFLGFILKNFKNKFGGIKKLTYLCNPNEKRE
jgi:hypothetical protein